MTNEPATALARARAAWGEACPDWIIGLAAECDRTSQAATARRIGKSGALVSQLLGNKYPADPTAIAQHIQGVLMAAMVDCPVVGDLAADACLAHQRSPWSPHNPQRIAFFRACRGGCPHSRIAGGTSHG